MSKSVVEYIGRRITYDSPLPFEKVRSRLDEAVRKETAGAKIFGVLRTSTTRAELEDRINELADGNDFIYFLAAPYDGWLNAYKGPSGPPVPQVIQYTIGNPLIGQSMLLQDVSGALHIPLKVLVVEKADGSGTQVIYDDPASIIPVPRAGEAVNDTVRSAAEALSVKLEKLVANITMPN